MTKTQTTIRVSPDTLAAIDAAAERDGTTRSHVIDRWLSQQAAADNAHAQPIEQQAWYRAGELAAKARDRLDVAATEIDDSSTIGHLLVALSMVADAIDVLAGTAPE